MSKRPVPASKIDEANMRAAAESHFARTQYGGVVEEMPFDQLLLAETDGIEDAEPPGEYEFYQRRAAIRGLFRYLQAEGYHPLKMMKRLWAVGSAMRIEPFCTMTMEERAMMFGETKAAVSWRMKVLSGLIELSGMRGSRLPGQKNKSSTPNYSASQQGNTNRRKKRRKRHV